MQKKLSKLAEVEINKWDEMFSLLNQLNASNLNPEASKLIKDLQAQSNINKNLLIKNLTEKKLEDSWTESLDFQFLKPALKQEEKKAIPERKITPKELFKKSKAPINERKDYYKEEEKEPVIAGKTEELNFDVQQMRMALGSEEILKHSTKTFMT